MNDRTFFSAMFSVFLLFSVAVTVLAEPLYWIAVVTNGLGLILVQVIER